MPNNDLNYSVFSDEQTLKNLRLILKGARISHIRAVDQELLDSAPLIREVEDTLGPGALVDALTRVKNFIPVTDALFFILESHKAGVTDLSLVVLNEAADDEKFLTRQQLMEILNNRDEIPMDWAVSMTAAAGENRYAANEFNKSSLNLDAFRNFH